MRYAQPVVMVVGAVLFVVCFMWGQQPATSDDVNGPPQALAIAFAIFIGWTVLLLVATVLTIVDSVRGFRAAQTKQLATNAMVVKLASIPLFAFVYIALVAFFLGGFGFGGAVLWLVGAMGIGLSYLAMLSTSVYSWAAIARLRRERIIGTGLTALYAIMSVLFFTDTAASVLLFGHSRRRPRLAIVWVLIATGVTVITLGLLFFLFSFLVDSWRLGDEFGYFFGVGSLGWVPISVIIFAIAVTLATLVVSYGRRSTLRVEGQQAALRAGTSIESDASERVHAG